LEEEQKLKDSLFCCFIRKNKVLDKMLLDMNILSTTSVIHVSLVVSLIGGGNWRSWRKPPTSDMLDKF
jgi:hypothetical protein